MKLLVATTNAHKLHEIRPLLSNIRIELLTLADLPSMPEPAESGATFWANAREKALTYAATCGVLVVAEDSGLEVTALSGEPGVHSARFLGRDASYPQRFEEILRRLSAQAGTTRDARFVTAIAVARGAAILFETEAWIDGEIAAGPIGEHGFGYDPIFFYPPLGLTLAQLERDQKSAVSHRGKAFALLRDYLINDSHLSSSTGG